MGGEGEGMRGGEKENKEEKRGRLLLREFLTHFP